MFEFFLSTNIKFGCGARFFLKELLARERWKIVGLIVDHNISDLPIVAEFIDDLKHSLKSLIIGKCTLSEPTYQALEEMRSEFCHPSLHAVIGLGGGSALDMAKAMAVLVHNRKPAIEYRGFNKMAEPVLPLIAIPTTAGTGSEVTPNASFIDTVENKKLGINGEAIRPRYALLDPELTVSCPKAPTISAAVDSIVHATEAYVAQKTNPMARLFAREGFQRVFNALPHLVCDLENVHLRQETMYGAFLSGIALMHSGTGPAAAMSYPLGVHYGVPHGLGGGIFLPHVIEHNIQQGYTGYDELFYGAHHSKPVVEFEAAHDFLTMISDLWVQLEIPHNLSLFGYGGSQPEKETFVKETLELKGALEQNPVPFGNSEITKVLENLSRN